MAAPLVSVILPAYNASAYIDAAIRSILTQDYRDFELIIADDGSTDDTLSKIKAHSDRRIKVIEHTTNYGLIDTLNELLAASEGQLVARMDADDISSMNRLYLQVDFLNKHPAIGVVSSFMGTLSAAPKVIRHRFVNSAEIKSALPFTNPIVHPAVMFNTTLTGQRLTYSKNYLHAEDYALWLSLLPHTEFAVLPYPLLMHRAHHGQVSVKHYPEQLASISKAQQHFFNLLNVQASDKELELHLSLFLERYPKEDATYLDSVEQWLLKLSDANQNVHLIPSFAFEQTCDEWWFRVNQHYAKSGLSNYQRYNCSALAGKYKIPAASKAKMFVRSLTNIRKINPKERDGRV